MRRPNVGEDVHYVSHGTPGGEYHKECRAAKITEVVCLAIDPATGKPVDAWVVGLCVMNPTGLFFDRSVVEHRGVDVGADREAARMCTELSHDGGTWHRPVLRA